MPSSPAWRRYLRFWGPDVDADVDDELRFHLERRVADYQARGLSPADAERAAAERFGDAGEIGQLLRSHDQQREQRREGTDCLRALRRQLPIAVRSRRPTPRLSLMGVLTPA